jgi:hypothetical protein
MELDLLRSRREQVRIETDNIDDLRQRFYDFYDGVVCAVRIDIRSDPRTCEIDIQAKDRDSASGWSNVRLTVRKMSEFRFQLGRTTFEVLSGGIQFGWRETSLCVVLDAYPDDGPDLPDLKTNIAYVVGASCDVDIAPVPS